MNEFDVREFSGSKLELEVNGHCFVADEVQARALAHELAAHLSDNDHGQLDAFEDKKDELVDGLRESYAAGFAQAVETFDIDADFDTSVSALEKNAAVTEQHYYYWDGKVKPLELWLLKVFGLDDFEHDDDSDDTPTVLTDGGTTPVGERGGGRGQSTTDDLRSENAPSSDRETITVCPECDEPGIQPLNGGTHMPPRDHDYRCKACTATFDEPAERERKRPDHGRAGLAGKLMQADPDDVSAEHVDGEPMTDGGHTWQDFETWVMQQHTTANDIFHSSADCPRIKNPERAIERSEHYVAYHEPRPCVDCHPEVGNPERGKAVTDGGIEEDANPRDPSDDPAACSKCGVHIGAFGGEYCDPCAREIGAKPPIERCMHCGQDAPQEQMESVDLSADDEYYPEIRYLCQSCAGGADDGA